MADVPSDDVLLTLSSRVGYELKRQNLQLTTAESCTGGWVAKLVTDVVGSSAWFERGFVTYTNTSKHELLGISEDLLNKNGAVSEPVVRAMVEGAITHSEAEIALAITGIAGPSGGTPFKPVGMVWFGWARKTLGEAELKLISEERIFQGDRDAVRRQAVAHALNGVLEYLL